MMFPDSVEDRINLISSLKNQYDFLTYLDSNGYADPYGKYEWLIMAGNHDDSTLTTAIEDWDLFSNWIEKHQGKYRAGYISYPASKHNSRQSKDEFAQIGFYIPELVIGKKRNGERIIDGKQPESESGKKSARKYSVSSGKDNGIRPIISREDYKLSFERIQKHLYRGDIYEMNFCQPFRANKPELDVLSTWGRMNSISPMPFSCIVKDKHLWLLGESPERFLCKREKQIISQPIKGTCKKTGDENTDAILARELVNSEKERNENIMIVDLVRNDLSQTLLPGSVKVLELCGVYKFTKLQHLISTVTGTLSSEKQVVETIRKAFPMGSMTGAPKLNAIRIAAEYEPFSRGIYSGSVGYFDPEDDFDLNVVIRSIVWNANNGYLNFAAGSAVTVMANADAEYDECFLKAEALFECLQDE